MKKKYTVPTLTLVNFNVNETILSDWQEGPGESGSVPNISAGIEPWDLE